MAKGTIPRMNALPPLITEHLEEVRALCEKYAVKRLTLFGSAVKGTFDPETSERLWRISADRTRVDL